MHLEGHRTLQSAMINDHLSREAVKTQRSAKEQVTSSTMPRKTVIMLEVHMAECSLSICISHQLKLVRHQSVDLLSIDTAE